MTPILAAAAAGLLGSVHCAGMCGPLVLAGAVRHGRVSAVALAEYLGGRFTAYALGGAAMGALGQHALCVLPVSAVQLASAAAVGALCAVRGATLLGLAPRWVVAPRLVRDAISLLFRALPRRGVGLGLATGLMPCGMLVAAWALAASTCAAPLGALSMLAFGLASVPGLLAPVVVAGLRRRPLLVSPRVQGVAWMALAGWIAVRPLLAAAHVH